MKYKALILIGVLIAFSTPCWASEMTLQDAIGYSFDDSMSQGYELWTTFSPADATLLVEISSSAPFNSFGIYEKDNPSNKLELFSGSNSPVVTNTFDVNWSYGFYLENPKYTWFSQNSLNSDQSQHVLAFQESPSSYFLAWEDLPIPIADKDFQDMVIHLNHAGPVSAPEPGTMALLASGLIGLAVFGRKRSKRN